MLATGILDEFSEMHLIKKLKSWDIHGPGLLQKPATPKVSKSPLSISLHLLSFLLRLFWALPPFTGCFSFRVEWMWQEQAWLASHGFDHVYDGICTVNTIQCRGALWAAVSTCSIQNRTGLDSWDKVESGPVSELRKRPGGLWIGHDRCVSLLASLSATSVALQIIILSMPILVIWNSTFVWTCEYVIIIYNVALMS